MKSITLVCMAVGSLMSANAVKLSSEEGFNFGAIAGMAGGIAGGAVGGKAGAAIAQGGNTAAMAANGNIKGAVASGVAQGAAACPAGTPGCA